jgi:hypothetical protein
MMSLSPLVSQARSASPQRKQGLKRVPTGERRPMQFEGPHCLPGPFTKERPWWNDPDFGSIDAAPALPHLRGAAEVKPINENNPKPPDPPIRTDLVERIRREIAAGTYDTPEKLEAALDRMLRRLAEE